MERAPDADARPALKNSILDRPTRYEFILKCSNQPSIREDRIYVDEGDPPAQGDVLEITFMRERMKVRVLSILWPDQTGVAPVEITIEKCGEGKTHGR